MIIQNFKRGVIMKKVLLGLIILGIGVLCYAEYKSLKTKEVSVGIYSPVQVSLTDIKMLNMYFTKETKFSFTGDNYITLPAGSSANFNNLSFNNLTLYFQCTTDTGLVEIIYGR